MTLPGPPADVVTPQTPSRGRVRFSEDVLCDTYKYEIDVEAGEVVSHGPAASMQGALAMELPTVSLAPCEAATANQRLMPLFGGTALVLGSVSSSMRLQYGTSQSAHSWFAAGRSARLKRLLISTTSSSSQGTWGLISDFGLFIWPR